VGTALDIDKSRDQAERIAFMRLLYKYRVCFYKMETGAAM